MVVLDTDFIIDLMAGDVAAGAVLDGLLASPDPLAVSSVTIMQLHHGIPRARMPARERERVVAALRGFAAYPVTAAIAAAAGELDGELTARGRRVDPLDLLIGMTAVHHHEPLVTRNRKDFARIPGIQIRP